MKMRFIFTLAMLVLAVQLVDAQQNWKRYRYELCVGAGTTNFLGELGGGVGDGTHFISFKDLDLKATRPNWQGSIRYRISEMLAFKTAMTVGVLKGEDEFSGNINRRNRNLSFRSVLYEFGGQFEIYLKYDRDKRFRKSSAIDNLSVMLVGGAYLIYFNPKAQKDGAGEWIALQPLGTEGQGQKKITTSPEGIITVTTETNPAKYKRIAGAFPIGLAARYNINKRWSVGLEITNRFTTTDYLDDVSSNYYNFEEAEGVTGFSASEEQKYFADRHINVSEGTYNGKYVTNTPFRGNPKYKDSYIFVFAQAIYKLKGGKSFLPKFFD